MANNLKTLQSRIESDINPNGAPSSILAINHQEILIDVLKNAGKQVGVHFVAEKQPSTITTGKLSFNGNAFNNISEFTIEVSKLSSDLNDVGQIFQLFQLGSIIHFKDFAGRSAYFVFQSFSASDDGFGNDTYEVNVKGIASNPNYIYGDTESEICSLSFYSLSFAFPADLTGITNGQIMVWNNGTNQFEPADLTGGGETPIRQRKVIAIVDNTIAPPTEVEGDRYILDETGGGVHGDWDGASANDIVQFTSGSWVATTPEEGFTVYVDDENVDYRFIDDGTPVWEQKQESSGGGSPSEIIVTDKSQIINQVLFTDKIYLIATELILLTTEYIEVPAGGLNVSGYGFNISKITKNVTGEEIFKSPVGGSGDFITGMIQYSSGDGSVFDMEDIDGTHAIELNDVNFVGCSSIGELNGYRQLTGTTIGFYGCSDGLILSGTWNGFKILNTNAFSFGSSGTFLKEGTSLLFNNRVFINMNIDFPIGSVLLDLQSSNFNDNELLQINATIAKRDGILNLDNAQFLIPNISANDQKCLWSGNIGLPDSADEKFVENTDIGSTYDVDWLKNTFLLTMTEDCVLSDVNLPASGKNSEEIKIYLTTNGFNVTFPSGWDDNKVGTIKSGEINEILVKYLKTGVYFMKINNSLSTYPAPDLSSVSPISMLPSETRDIDLYGSFFTPATIVTVGDLTIIETVFINSGHIRVKLTSTPTEEELDITITNGTTVVFTGYFEVNIGTVFVPQPDEWTLDAGSVDYSSPGQVLTASNNTTGTATWTGVDIDFSKDLEVRFSIFKSPLGGTSFGTVYILNLIDKITSAMGGTSSQYSGVGLYGTKSTDDEVVQTTLGNGNYNTGVNIKMKWYEATKTMEWYLNNVLKDTSINTIFATNNLQTLEINIGRNMDVKNIKYIEID